MNARLARRFGIVLAAFTVAGCATQPTPGDTVSQTSLRINGMHTSASANGKPTLRQSLDAMDRPDVGCTHASANRRVGCVEGRNSASLAVDLAAALKSDPSDDADDVASDDSGDGSLSHAAPIAADTPDVSYFHQTGNASWYGADFHGRRTASGEPYDMNEFTAAHRSLPLLSYVRVTNVSNKRSVIVKINDRGPFHGRRILDLSMAAAKILGMQHRGTERVSITGLSPSEARAELNDPVLASR